MDRDFNSSRDLPDRALLKKSQNPIRARSVFGHADIKAFRLYAGAAVWADILDLKNYIVIEDGEAGPVLDGLSK
jgi:hypothetical protein